MHDDQSIHCRGYRSARELILLPVVPLTLLLSGTGAIRQCRNLHAPDLGALNHQQTPGVRIIPPFGMFAMHEHATCWRQLDGQSEAGE
jgi:hypothetical protein